MARRRRKARRNPRGRRRARRNPARSRRRARRNPGSGVFARADSGIEQQLMSPAGAMAAPRRKRKRKHYSKKTRLARRRRAARNKVYRGRAKGLMVRVRALKGVKGRSYQRSSLRTQASRYRTLAKVKTRSVRKSPVYKAMHLKANPGLAGVLQSAKVLVPQGVVGAGAMVLLAMGGRAIAARIPTASLGAAAPYVPAVATLGLTGIGYVIADKVAPRFKGAVAIGGIIGAILLAVGASSFGARVKAAFSLGEYTMVGGGIFRGDSGVGEYTMVGSGGDNSTEFAHDGLRGADDHTEFAPGEGGVLSGSGIFRT